MRRSIGLSQAGTSPTLQRLFLCHADLSHIPFPAQEPELGSGGRGGETAEAGEAVARGLSPAAGRLPG